MHRFQVSYYVKVPGALGNGNPNSMSGQVRTQSETLVMQEIRRRHPGKEITLRDLKWK